MSTIDTADEFWDTLWNELEILYWATAERTAAVRTQYSCWLTMSGATGVAPTTWAACSRSTTGAIPYTVAGSGYENRLYGMSCASSTGKRVELWDRLGHCGGIDANSASSQAVNSAEVTRGIVSGGHNLVWFVEVNSAPGSTGRTLTINGTDYDSASRTPTVAIPASAVVTSLIRIPTPGYNLRTIESVQFAGGVMGSSGNLGLVAAKLLHAPDPAVNSVVSGPEKTGLVKLESNTCLWLQEGPITPAAAHMHGHILVARVPS